MLNRHSQSAENAFTGLELVIVLAAALLLIGYIGYGELSPGKSSTTGGQPKQKQGMITNEIVTSTNLITDPGGMFGYPAVDGSINSISVRFTSQDAQALGAFQLTVQPFMMTTGSIDMGHASVIWMSGTDQEELSLSQAPVLVCPNWTITQKANFVPYKGADQDLLLEGSEQFTILVCPSGHASPNQQFTMTIAPRNGKSLPLTRMVPPAITPLTSLG